MALLGTLLRNRRADERRSAWNQPNLTAPETLGLTSLDFTDHGPLPARHAGRRTGGRNVSPHLAWSAPPEGTAELLLVIEDLDIPLGSAPAVHCLAVIDQARDGAAHELPTGGLAGKEPTRGVTPLRSTIGRGYQGPGPVRGHGPHRYVVQLYALGESLLTGPRRDTTLKARPRQVLASLDVPVLARGRITGTYER